MKKSLLKILVLSVVCIIFTGCATMTRWFDSNEKNKRMYTVRIDSRTRGLPVYYTDKGVERFVGYTPCTLYSDKAKIHYVTVKNGDVHQTVTLKREGRLSTYWNFVPYYTFIWGYFVDQGTGRGRVYGQKDYYVDM